MADEVQYRPTEEVADFVARLDAFYAGLTPEQQRLFDALAARPHGDMDDVYGYWLAGVPFGGDTVAARLAQAWATHYRNVLREQAQLRRLVERLLADLDGADALAPGLDAEQREELKALGSALAGRILTFPSRL